MTELGGCELGLSNRQDYAPTSSVAKYSGRVVAGFSPDEKHLVTASGNTVKICELNDKQWQEKATIVHRAQVNDACFSPDGKCLVTVADNTAKICELNDEHCQEKATIKHDGVSSVCFSPDGKHLVTTNDNTAKIYGLNGRQWQEKATIKHDL